MIDDGTEIFHTQIIRPGDRDIHPVDHIFPFFVIKITVLHDIPLLSDKFCDIFSFHFYETSNKNTAFLMIRCFY